MKLHLKGSSYRIAHTIMLQFSLVNISKFYVILCMIQDFFIQFNEFYLYERAVKQPNFRDPVLSLIRGLPARCVPRSRYVIPIFESNRRRYTTPVPRSSFRFFVFLSFLPVDGAFDEVGRATLWISSVVSSLIFRYALSSFND